MAHVFFFGVLFHLNGLQEMCRCSATSFEFHALLLSVRQFANTICFTCICLFADGYTGDYGGPRLLSLQSQDHQGPGQPQRYILACILTRLQVQLLAYESEF